MYTHILIATDGSEVAECAVEHGLKLAKATGAKATVVTVTEPWDALVIGDLIAILPEPSYEENVAMTAAKILDKVTETARRIGQPCETLHIKQSFPAEGIAACAREKGCDLVVVSSHGRRGIGRLMLGSVASQVVATSKVPVLICRP